MAAWSVLRDQTGRNLISLRENSHAARRREMTVSTPRIVNTLRPFVAVVFALAFTGCATLDLSVPRVESHAWPEPEATTLGRAFGDRAAAAEGKSGFYLLASGMEAFALRAALAEVAQRTLDLQYYAVHDDATGQLLLDRLLAAAKRGVRVRFLIDAVVLLGAVAQPAMKSAATVMTNVRMMVSWLAWRGKPIVCVPAPTADCR